MTSEKTQAKIGIAVSILFAIIMLFIAYAGFEDGMVCGRHGNCVEKGDAGWLEMNLAFALAGIYGIYLAYMQWKKLK
jgi:hypothetical protein